MSDESPRVDPNLLSISSAMSRTEANVGNLTKRVDEIAAAMVTKVEFSTVQKIVYGAVALILATVVGWVLLDSRQTDAPPPINVEVVVPTPSATATTSEGP